MKAKRQYQCSRTALALALLSVFGAAYAADDTVQQLASPDRGYVGVGVGGVSGDEKDRSLFGIYNGLRKDDAYLLLDFGYVKRDEATGTWTVVEGRDLGLETPEVRGFFGPQGNWKVYGEYMQIVRRDPRTYNTSEQGAGTTTPTVTLLPVQGTGSEVELKLKRQRALIGGEKWITPHLLLEASFQNEDKSGARLFGRGFTCPSGAAPTPVCTALATGANQWALLWLPEPVSSTTQQVEAKLSWIVPRGAFQLAYYGSFYKNDYSALVPTVNGNLNNGLGNPMGGGGGVALTAGLRNILQTPMALPPDNQAHQFSVAGNYRVTPTTNATFKYSYTHATQDQDFGIFQATNITSRSNLGGEMDTQLAQAGVNATVIPRLHVLADVKYQDRKDKTPIDYYNVEGTSVWTNGALDNKKTNGKVQATYDLPYDLRGTAGFDYEHIDRDTWTPTDVPGGVSGLRQNTTERGWRLEVGRSMSESLTGLLSYVSSYRDGSTYLKPLSGPPGVMPASQDCASATVNGVPNACIWSRTAIFPFELEDRRRDKIRALADWEPTEKLSLQFAADYGYDRYTGPTEKGLSSAGVHLYSVDAAYALSETVKLTGYYSYGEQTLHVAHSTGYIASIKDKNNTAGVGVIAKATAKLTVRGDLMYLQDRNLYDQTLDAGGSAANAALLAQGGLPDAVYRDFRIKLTGTYAVQKNGDVSLEVVHDRAKLDEWTWGYNGVNFAYSDNTTVFLNPNQNVTFVALTYRYRFK